MNRVVDLLRDLVRIDTTNPPGNERVLCERVANWLAGYDIETTIDEYEPGRANLFAQVVGSRPGPTLMFNTHTDVVPPGDGWTRGPFSGDLEAGIVYGRGSADAKGSLAAMCAALVTFAADAESFSGTIQLTGVADEEVGSRGARHLLTGARPDAVIVGEPTNLRLVAAHKGSLRPVVELVGVSAHAAQPEYGLNAIGGGAALLGRLDQLQSQLSKRQHPLVGHPTIVPVLIEGGEAPNMVPRYCRITFDRRLIPPETEEQAMAEFNDWLMEFEAQSNGIKASVVRLAPSTGGPSETATEHPFVKACQAGLAEVGLSFSLSGMAVNCDMTHFRTAGVPAVVCGPGSPDVMHVRDEHLSVKTLEHAVSAYVAMARQYLAAGGSR